MLCSTTLHVHARCAHVWLAYDNGAHPRPPPPPLVMEMKHNGNEIRGMVAIPQAGHPNGYTCVIRTCLLCFLKDASFVSLCYACAKKPKDGTARTYARWRGSSKTVVS